MKERRGEKGREKEEEEERYGKYVNFEYGMLCFCIELVWKCLYGY